MNDINSGKLELVESKRSLKSVDNGEVKNITVNKVADSIMDNFGNILNLANDIVEIKKMKVQSDAIILKMREDRESLLAEAEAYAKRKNADTSSVIEKMKVIQSMIRDFYQFNNSSMTSEDFSKVITEIVTQMGNIE